MATHSSILAWRIPGTEEPSIGQFKEQFIFQFVFENDLLERANLFYIYIYELRTSQQEWASQAVQWYRIHLPMQETQETRVRSLGREDPLEQEMATHSSILAWRIP